MSWRLGFSLVLFATACQEAPVLVLSDRDGGAYDGGLDAGVPECWTLDDFVGTREPLRQLGWRVALTDEHVFAAADETTGGASWAVVRIANRGNEWGIDRKLRGGDFGHTGDEVEALEVADDGLWLGVPTATNGGAVHHVSFDLEPIGPALALPEASASFGYRVVRSGPWLFVSDPDRGQFGAVEVFAVVDGMPEHVKTLRLDSTPQHGRFGEALAARGDTLLVGEPEHCDNVDCTETGRVRVFSVKTGTWELERTIEPTDERTRRFGSSIAWPTEDVLWITAPASYSCVETCSGRAGTLGAGACESDEVPCRYAGAAFEVDQETLTFRGPSELGTDTRFNLKWGETIRATDAWIAVAAPGDSSCSYGLPVSFSCANAGAVHLFAASSERDVPRRYLKPYDLEGGLTYSRGLALRGRRLAVGAPQHCGEKPEVPCNGQGYGGVYIYSGCASP